MEYEDITRKIIGCVYKVYNTMGFGFLESVYEKCLVIELHRPGVKVESQRSIPVRYQDVNLYHPVILSTSSQ
jgi:GxxExxY protein